MSIISAEEESIEKGWKTKWIKDWDNQCFWSNLRRSLEQDFCDYDFGNQALLNRANEIANQGKGVK